MTLTKQQITEQMKLTLNTEELMNCMRCGFCQPACPTFKETGLEAASPRGRLALMKAVVDGLMEPDESFERQMDLCLGCRACEPVCPADVKYGHLLEQTRDVLQAGRKQTLFARFIQSLTLKHLFPHHHRMRLLGLGLKIYQRSGMRPIVRKLGLINLLSKHLRQMEQILPDASSSGVVKKLGIFIPAEGKAVARVGMFRGCIMDILFTETNMNTVKLLSKAGFDVVIPNNQTCCGAMHAHSGNLQEARKLAKSNIQTFQKAGVDYIVSNAGGCGASLIEYDHLLKDDQAFAQDAAWFSKRVRDISEIILESGHITFKNRGKSNDQVKYVTYQNSCHLKNVMKAGDGPKELIERMDNVQYEEMKDADGCCGSAGIYNLTQPEMSMQILDHKMENVKKTNTKYILTSNPGCLLQMQLGIVREGLVDEMKAMHIVDFMLENIDREI